MTMPTDDLRILDTRPLVSPGELMAAMPVDDGRARVINEARQTIGNLLSGEDDRLLVVVGPCSIHDPKAALEYGERLRPMAEALADRLVVVMRVYFEKPRTVVGWKGLINDPFLDGSFRINDGLRMARQLMWDLTRTGLPVATEFLDTIFGQYFADLVSWGAIGARTAESQVHRELASGLSMPVGFKNRTDGNVQVAVDAIRAARQPHWFPSLTKAGGAAILRAAGNQTGHLVLRGGSDTGPNFDSVSVEAAALRLRDAGLPDRILIDCSHGNSLKEPDRQRSVAESVAAQVADGSDSILGVMIESHLKGGRQDLKPGQPLIYGQSITDACLSWKDTVPVLELLAESVAKRRLGI